MMAAQGRITPAMDGITQLEGITMTYRTEKMLEEAKARRKRERRLALGEQAEQNATAKEG